MQKDKLMPCLSLNSSSSFGPLSNPRLSLIFVIVLSWSVAYCAITDCPEGCFCSQSKQEISCRKGKMADRFVDFPPSLTTMKRLILNSVDGLDALSLADLDPLKDTLLTLKIKDSSVATIPPGTFALFTQLEELDLSGNQLLTLEAGSFNGLTNLRTLDLSNNRLLNLVSSLNPLGSLESLDLSGNSLQELPGGVFSNQTALIRLRVNGNPLKSLNAQSFNGLSKVRELHMRDCSLTSVEDDLFMGKADLRDLDLGQNRLTSFLSTKATSHLSYLTSLFFDNNEIQKLSQYAFRDLRLNLLDLSYNRINSIDPLAFENSTMKVLDLSYNMVFSISQSFLKPLSTHMNSLSLAGNPMGKLPPNVFSDLQLLESLDISSCRLDALDYESFQDLHMLNKLDLSHNNLHSLSLNMLEFIDKLHVVNLHQNAWVCDCHIKPLSKWLRKSQSILKMHCPPSHAESQDCTALRCVSPSQLDKKQLIDLNKEDLAGCHDDRDSDGLPASTQGAIVASCMGFAIILLVITIYLWKRGKTGRGLKRACVPSDAESSHVIDEDSKVPPLSNCDRNSLNESDHEFVVRHYFDTLVTDPKLMSRTSDSEEPTSPKERDSLYSSQPSLYSNPGAAIESTV